MTSYTAIDRYNRRVVAHSRYFSDVRTVLDSYLAPMDYYERGIVENALDIIEHKRRAIIRACPLWRAWHKRYCGHIAR